MSITVEIERDVLDAIIEATEQALGDRPYFPNDDFPPFVERGLATMRKALAEYDEAALDTEDPGDPSSVAFGSVGSADAPDFVTPLRAEQHLNQDGRTHGLCGYVFDSMPRTTKVYDHRDGFDPKGGSRCAKCADAADVIQNGMR